ncbi:MAG TPA: type II toxin-antitoxin system VapC family toxin [Phycisphaerae bacterium]|nr:type II toxin-antitoxin system VapC family toxin [Phycisphaerae bacterium]
MKYLVDANVVSEGIKTEPVGRVIDWLRANESGCAVNPVVLGEVRYGILVLPEGSRRKRLERWFWDGVAKVECLPLDGGTGLRWAELLGDLRRRGVAIPVKDSLIAATALEYGLTVATRNVRDFVKAGVKVVNPFEG